MLSHVWLLTPHGLLRVCLPGSSVHGILQARILEWVAIPSPGNLSDPGIEPGVLHCRQILYQLSYEGSPICMFRCFKYSLWINSFIIMWLPSFSLLNTFNFLMQIWLLLVSLVAICLKYLFHTFILSLYVFLKLKWVSYKQHIIRSCFFSSFSHSMSFECRI